MAWDTARKHPRRQFRHARRIQVQPEAEERIPAAGSRHLTRNRQIHGEDEHARGVVFEHLVAEHQGLGPLGHKAQGRPERGVAPGSVFICERRRAYVPGSRSGNTPSC